MFKRNFVFPSNSIVPGKKIHEEKVKFQKQPNKEDGFYWTFINFPVKGKLNNPGNVKYFLRVHSALYA